MELQRNIQAALTATRKLDEALRSGDLMSCTKLLDLREEALEIFADSHRRASSAERESCHQLLEQLVHADDDLQAVGREKFAKASSDLHRSPQGVRDLQSLAACIDRKA